MTSSILLRIRCTEEIVSALQGLVSLGFPEVLVTVYLTDGIGLIDVEHVWSKSENISILLMCCSDVFRSTHSGTDVGMIEVSECREWRPRVLCERMKVELVVSICTEERECYGKK